MPDPSGIERPLKRLDFGFHRNDDLLGKRLVGNVHPTVVLFDFVVKLDGPPFRALN